MVVTREDVGHLSEALKRSFPNIVIMACEHTFLRSAKPSEKCYASIGDCPSSFVDMYLAPEGWTPEYVWREETEKRRRLNPEMNGSWYLSGMPLPALQLQRRTEVQSFAWFRDKAPPHLAVSSFLMSYNLDDKEQLRVKAKINRLLDKVVTSKTRLVNVRTGEDLTGRSFKVWAGHDAIRWCREDPARVLNFKCPHVGDCRAWIPA